MTTSSDGKDAKALDSVEYTCEDVAQSLARIDVDGTLRTVAADAFRGTRAAFLGRALAAMGAAAGGLVAAADVQAAPSDTKNDIAILRFDLVLEYLQAGLYTEAERLAKLTPKTLAWARVVGAHERAHALAIKNLLGRRAVPSPGFDYGTVTSKESAFIKTAVAFEDLTAALLKWQAPRLDSRSVLAAVITLHSVETRHAAWIRHIVGLKPATTPFDKPASQQQMARLIASTHFVTSRAKTKGKGKPRYTG
jgi:hypothetical protein